MAETDLKQVIRRNLLHQHISSAQDIGDLRSILECMPLDSIQNMMHAHIDEETATDTLKQYVHRAIPIDDILPECIMQYILSFNLLNHAKSVNTKWKKYSENNEALFVKRRLQTMVHDEHDPGTNTTLLIHPSRKTLHPWEARLGWKGPVNTRRIEDIINLCNSTASHPTVNRILIHNGQYTNDKCSSLSILNGVHLIGIGDNVVFKYEVRWTSSFLTIARNLRTVSIENIKFDLKSLYPYSGTAINRIAGDRVNGHIVVKYGSKLILNNCTMIGNGGAVNGIVTNPKSDVDVRGCEFINYVQPHMAVGVDKSANSALVKDCVFNNCCIKTECVKVLGIGSSSSVILKCVNNSYVLTETVYTKLKVQHFITMIKEWMEEDESLTKKKIRYKLVSLFGITIGMATRRYPYWKMVKQAIKVIQAEQEAEWKMTKKRPKKKKK
eukprot:220826_1